MSAYLHILRCVDGSYYTGTTRGSLETRLAEHEAGAFDGFTARRRPVNLVFYQEFQRMEDGVAAKRQVKGWRREKKEALIRGDFAALPELSRPPSRRGPRAAPEDEVGADAIKGRPHPKRPPPGPRVARPEDRRHGCLEGCTRLVWPRGFRGICWTRSSNTS